MSAMPPSPRSALAVQWFKESRKGDAAFEREFSKRLSAVNLLMKEKDKEMQVFSVDDQRTLLLSR